MQTSSWCYLAQKLMVAVFTAKQSTTTTIKEFFRAHPQCGRQDREKIVSAMMAGFRHWRKVEVDTATANRYPQFSAWSIAQWHNAFSALPLDSPNETVIAQGADFLQTIQTPSAINVNGGDAQSAPMNLPSFWWEHLSAQFAEQSSAMAQAFAKRPPLDVRINPWRIDRDRAQKLIARHYAVKPLPHAPFGLRIEEESARLNKIENWHDDFAAPQELGSQWIVSACPLPKSGGLIVDYCAGAGGKTLGILARLHKTRTQSLNPTLIFACDTSSHRLEKLQARLIESKIEGVRVETCVLSPSENPQNSRLSAALPITQRLAGRANLLLVDAPCTGIGTLRRAPEIAWKLSQNEIQQLLIAQKNILESASLWVAPKGYLLYATCSWWREENENRVDAFLADHPEFSPAPLPKALQSLGLQATWRVGVNPLEHQSDGYFIALMQKTA